jgi:uncharacterized protein (DUF608 family)
LLEKPKTLYDHDITTARRSLTMSTRLFPTDLPDRTWSEFPAAGFARPVAGVIHHGTNPPVCGMPIGGIGTGCLDLEATGLLGFSTLFNCHVPRRGPINQPFLGLTVGRRTWLLTTTDLRTRRGEQVLKPVYPDWWGPGLHIVRSDILVADEIHYWGHYPVVDMEYVTSAPVQVGLRAWSPFIPGDVAISNTPGAVFEVHLRNETGAPQTGTLAFSFPGPNEVEAGTTRLTRQRIFDMTHGLFVASDKASYVLAVLGAEKMRVGGELGVDAGAWGHIWANLPQAKEQAGGSVAVDFELEPGAEKTVRFVLTWYSPHYQGGGTPAAGGNTYTNMYAARYGSAVEVAWYLAVHHQALLERILAWQGEVLSAASLPAWLRSDLVNYLSLIAEDGLWAQAKPPIGAWCRQEDGLFGLNESPRGCPQMECIPCSWYGNVPLVYFFPELALSTLRGYKAYQYPDGQAPWVFGGVTVGSPFSEMAMPARGYAHKPQSTLDGGCYVDMVDRMWLRTGDAELLREFYASVKANTIFTMSMRPGSGDAGIVSLPTGNNAQDWMENCDLYGIVPHIGGVHLAQLRMAGRMAEAMGDEAFARQCRAWLETGSAIMEERTWAGDSYLLYHEAETGKESNWVLGCQLDAEWMARSHGLPGVFRPEHVATSLETMKRTSIPAAAGDGSVAFCPPPPERGVTGEKYDPGYWGERGVHPPGTMLLAMTYMYAGQRETGLELARRVATAMMEAGWTWDLPVVFAGGTRERQAGFDYYQNLMLWCLPAALQGTDLMGPCRPGGLVERIIAAGRKK